MRYRISIKGGNFMKRFNKVVSVVVASAMVMAMAGCGSDANSGSADTDDCIYDSGKPGHISEEKGYQIKAENTD